MKPSHDSLRGPEPVKPPQLWRLLAKHPLEDKVLVLPGPDDSWLLPGGEASPLNASQAADRVGRGLSLTDGDTTYWCELHSDGSRPHFTYLQAVAGREAHGVYVDTASEQFGRLDSFDQLAVAAYLNQDRAVLED